MKPVRLAGLLGLGVGVLALPALLSWTAAPASAQQVDSIASVPRVSIEEFKKLLDTDGVIALDVRSPQAYQQGHIPGALSVPLETVEARAAEWRNAKKPIVTYCT